MQETADPDSAGPVKAPLRWTSPSVLLIVLTDQSTTRSKYFHSCLRRSRSLLDFPEPNKAITFWSIKTRRKDVLSDTVLVQDTIRGETALIHQRAKIIIVNFDIAVVSCLVLVRAKTKATSERDRLHLTSKQDAVGGQRHVEDLGSVDRSTEIAVLEGSLDLVPLVLLDGKWKIKCLQKISRQGSLVDLAPARSNLKSVSRGERVVVVLERRRLWQVSRDLKADSTTFTNLPGLFMKPPLTILASNSTVWFPTTGDFSLWMGRKDWTRIPFLGSTRQVDG
ncbi:hypothetical protein HG531_012408 [Fusarium graminearum]|nr:hypothetical protein HG531_012408 [Fusarium graminearum]